MYSLLLQVCLIHHLHILTVIVFVLLWRMCQEQPKSDSSYNSTIIQLLANCFHSFIHMIDIFCLGASLVIVCCVFGFQLSSHRKGGKRKGAVNPLQEAEYADLSILYIWYIYSLAYDFFNIFKSLVVREFLWVVTLHLHSIQNNCVQWGIYFVINEDI